MCIPFILSPNECWLHTCDACVTATWRLGLRSPLVARNDDNLILIQFYSFLRPWNRVKFWTYLDWAYPIPLGGPFITLSTILAEPFFFLLLDFGVLILVARVLPCALYSGPRAQNNGRSTDNVRQECRLDRPKALQTLILEQANKPSPVNLRFCLFVKIKSRSVKENYTRISSRFSLHLNRSENETWLRKNFFSLSRCPATTLKLFWTLGLGYGHQ